MLRELMDRAVCIHDDWNHVLGESDWDQFDTNPMLLGARRCVMHALLGFGDAYIDCLRRLRCFPEQIISPIRRSKSVVQDLLADGAALQRVRSALEVDGTCLSTYYSYLSMNLQDIISLPTRQVECVPPIDAFNDVISRDGSRELLRKAGVPMPHNEICRDLRDVEHFLSIATGRGHSSGSIVLKEHHRKLALVSDKAGLHAVADRLKFPLVAEVVHEVRCSPVIQSIRMGGQTENLFALKQRITNFHFEGNESPHGLDGNELAVMWEYSRQIADALPEFQGVFGVDYIVAQDRQIYAVDFNPRFNSSTYPYFFLERMGLDLADCHSRYGFVEDCHVAELSCLLAHEEFPRFDPATKSGVFIYNPVVDTATDVVRKWSYVAVAADAVGLASVISHFENVLAYLRTLAAVRIM